MEEESDSSSSNASIVEEESDEEEIIDPVEEFFNVLSSLECPNESEFAIGQKAVFRVILDKFLDVFCDSLEKSNSHISHISLGDGEGLEWPPLELTDGDEGDKWEKLFQSLAKLNQVESLTLKGYTLSIEMMTRILQALPGVSEVEIRLPCWILTEESLRPLLQVLSSHSCQSIHLEINGNIPSTASDVVGNIAVERKMLSELLCLNRLRELSIQNLNLALDTCVEVSTHLSSNSCSTIYLRIDSCEFQDEGGRLVAGAFRSNSILQELILTNVFGDNAFTDELARSLPLNQSIQEFSIEGFDVSWLPRIQHLLKCIAQQNRTMKAFSAFAPLFNWEYTETQEQELRLALQDNYTLEDIFVGMAIPCHEIMLLNKAGRRYLIDQENGGASNKTKCIEVLSHEYVQDELDCLFYHLRENPVLFTGTSSDRTSPETSNDRKRKADDSDDASDACLAKKRIIS